MKSWNAIIAGGLQLLPFFLVPLVGVGCIGYVAVTWVVYFVMTEQYLGAVVISLSVLLPWPMLTPATLAFICLLPATFGADSLANSRKAITQAVLLAPTLAVATYALNPLHQDGYLPANALFNCFWIIGFHCLAPALMLWSIRLLIHFARRRFNPDPN